MFSGPHRGFPACGVLAVLLVLLAGSAPRLEAQQPVSADSSIPLFAVMSAINGAGYDADLGSPHNSPIRKQLRAEIAAANPPSLAALRTFYAANRHPNAAQDLGRWVSFALLIKGPPDFEFRVKESELPIEVTELRDFRPLLAAFYSEAGLERLWEKYRPAYEAELQRYDEGLAGVMTEVTGYLRIPTSGFLGRNFSIYVDLLGAPGQANARSFGPDYYVVLSASPEPRLEEVRHGYLHYVLEPLAGKYTAMIRSKGDLREFADGAHALDPVLRRDFRRLLSESLIRAAELRLTSGTPVSKEQRIRDLLSEGYILAPYFHEALQAFEKQDAGMRIYFEEMIEKIDLGREQKRLAKVTFRAASPAWDQPEHLVALAPAAPPSGSSAATPTGAGASVAGSSVDEQRLVAEGEDALARSDLAGAQKAFEAVLARKGSLQAHATYGLALVATQQKQADLAKTFFQQTLNLGQDPRLLSWANIYLGRIFDMEQNRDLALKHYRQALETGHNEPATRAAAERGLQAPFRPDTARKEPGTEPAQP